MADPAPRRGAGNQDRNVRSSQEGGQSMGSERQPPPRRAGGGREPAGRERVGGGGGGGRGTDGSGKGRGSTKPMNDEGLHGASHIPTFGNWDTAGGTDPNFTVMFTIASKEKKGGPAAADPQAGNASGGGGTGDPYGKSNAQPKKQGSSWWCFG
uniref:RIN4 pathogenic type III effector avirulence factor Avr cleavage site domain-containing protein n=1 Tax=Physcomitrium patens TaxID=3218 RepID=A0A2K1INI5_PHYPA|nr:hypothetical protein PHYPA_027146 [Physcomitrium patens]